MSEFDDVISKQDQSVRGAIALGVEAKNFLTSDLAKYITNVAEINAENAFTQLSKVDPTDVKQIMRLQNQIERFNHYEACLNELVAAGDAAYQMYIQTQTD